MLHMLIRFAIESCDGFSVDYVLKLCLYKLRHCLVWAVGFLTESSWFVWQFDVYRKQS